MDYDVIAYCHVCGSKLELSGLVGGFCVECHEWRLRDYALIPRALDLFCGLGGWSDGLEAEGFDVLGVEIEPRIAALYKHPVIVADVCSLNPKDFKGYDLIVGSPPCRDFSKVGWAVGNNWKRKPDPEGEGMKLINAFLNFVEIAKPSYWLMENVPQAAPYVEKHRNIVPAVITKLGKNMKRAFWGNFPPFLVSRDYRKKQIGRLRNRKKINGELILSSPIKQNEVYDGWLRSWEAARIPSPVAQALGKAVKEALKP